MFALVFLLAGASAQQCIHDSRLQALTRAEFTAREQIQGFSQDGMWKMPKLAQHATEEELEDCATCHDAEVQVELMQAQMGENPLLNELDGIYYPVQNMYASNGFKLSYKDVPHEVPEKVKSLLEHRAGSLEIQINGYRQFTEGDAERLVKNHEEVAHIAPQGLGPFFQDARVTHEKKPALIVKAAQKSLAEYASQIRVLKDIEKSSTKGSGVYLILKEGFVMAPNFKSQFKKLVNEAPKDWDMLFLRTGQSKAYSVRCEDAIPGTNIYEMRRPVTTADGTDKFYNGIDGYVIRRQSVAKVLKLLKNSKAAPLNELLMSVHTEEKERQKDGKVNYKVEGIYSYMVTDSLLQTVALPKPAAPKPPPAQVKDNQKEQKEDKKEEKPKKAASKFLQTV
eukprot:gnl/MRDRNA2_/MRDRNA2_107455_c0_seq1.p1 gnl/MRDRNA2_/MRDRNA2_107455_c0~~gnl/MRDRNA2_/MRDRNA2_107455_c0_seq1.p1  ORF type:complete len:395 (+),score=126.85 gnl/MRDRNA2_/MRDRNA2_107455_c0_seq1:75-1259(+)